MDIPGRPGPKALPARQWRVLVVVPLIFAAAGLGSPVNCPCAYYHCPQDGFFQIVPKVYSDSEYANGVNSATSALIAANRPFYPNIDTTGVGYTNAIVIPCYSSLGSTSMPPNPRGLANCTVAQGRAACSVAPSPRISISPQVGPGLPPRASPMRSSPSPPLQSGPQGPQILVSYIGASGGGTTPLLSNIAAANQCSRKVDFYLVLSFLVDDTTGSGVLAPRWDQSSALSDARLPSFVAQAKANSGCKTGVMVSLGGQKGIWKTKTSSDDEDRWVANAFASIQRYLNMGIIGVDIDYEFISRFGSDPVGGDWERSMCKLIAKLKASSTGLKISIAPYNQDENAYVSVLSRCGANIDWINYQIYSDLGTTATLDQYKSSYTAKAPKFGGFNKLLFGACPSCRHESTEPSYGGSSDFSILVAAAQFVKSQGGLGAFMWSQEHAIEGTRHLDSDFFAVLNGNAASN